MSTTAKSTVITTTDMHTGGEPVRIVETGYPEILGSTLLAKLNYAKLNLDNYRKLLMLEPRGHSDMYGAILTTPDNPLAQLAVLFLNNEGYSTMCGHATIALARYAVDKKIITPITPPETSVNIQCPCGLVRAFVKHDDTGNTTSARFLSVPAFAFDLDFAVNVPDYGKVLVDIGYGGAYYAILPAERLNLNLENSNVKDLSKAASAITNVIRKALKFTLPESEEPIALYGTILTDGKDDFSEKPTSNICVFADEQIDRSPTGSGVTARIAIQFTRKQIKIGQQRCFRSCIGTTFVGKPVNETECSGLPAVVVEVEGRAFYTGNNKFILEADDPLNTGFYLK